jgi:hypothetical protein
MSAESYFIGNQASDEEVRSQRARNYGAPANEELVNIMAALDDLMSASDKGRSFMHTETGWMHAYEALKEGTPEKEEYPFGMTWLCIMNSVSKGRGNVREVYDVVIDHYEGERLQYGSAWRFTRFAGNVANLEVRLAMDDALDVFSAKPGIPASPRYTMATPYDVKSLSDSLAHIQNLPSITRQSSSETV